MAISSWEKFKHMLRSIRVGTERYPIIYNLRDYTSNKYIRIFLKICLLPFSAFKYFFPGNTSREGREGLAFVLIAKNEAPYIEEWINFHHKQGVSHFFIYDNESEDNLHEVLMPYIESGLVTYHFIKGRCRQTDTYHMAIHDYGRKFRYMGFIDADEFVFIRKNPYRGGGGGYNLYDFIDDFMNTHKNAGGIAVHHLNFGSSGHETKPEGGVLENYTRCSAIAGGYYSEGATYWTKMICDPMKVLGHALHCAFYVKGYYGHDENGTILLKPYSEYVSFSFIRINHYPVKSREEFIAKKNRGIACSLSQMDMSYFTSYDRNEFTDTEILSRI